MYKRIKSYGERYIFTKVKVKINRMKILKILFGFSLLAEIILGVLWILGF